MTRQTLIGSLLRRYRLRAELTQEELSDRAGVSARTVSDIECGAQQRPRADTLRSLAGALDVRPAEREALLAAVGRGPGPSVPAPPAQAFVGRAGEIERVLARLRERRFVTVTGPAGVGKTALALAVAAALQARRERVAFVDLIAAAGEADVAAAIVRALVPGRGAAAEDLFAVLAEVPTALVLDNFEHVLGAAPLIAQIVARAPRAQVLVTSRKRLRVRGECAIALSPLPRGDAARLFEERARAHDASFAVPREDAADVDAICERLDRLPLAIELAAPRVRILSLRSLRARLDDGLELLADGPVDAHERQRTMRSAIAWSYDLLTPPQQDAFRRLAVFPGAFTLEAALVVAPYGERMLGLLDALVDASLLTQRDDGAPERRFEMLRTIRDFACERLAEDRGVAHEAHCRLADYYEAFAQRAGEALEGGDERARGELDAERENLESAAADALERGKPGGALRLLAPLAGYYARAEVTHALYRTLDAATRHAPAGIPPLLLARAHLTLLVLADRLDLIADARRAAQGAVVLARVAGHALVYARALLGLGACALRAGEHEAAREPVTSALDVVTALGPGEGAARALRADALLHLGKVDYATGNAANAERALRGALLAYEALADGHGASEALLALGLVAAASGDVRALPYLQRALALRRLQGDEAAMVRTLAAYASALSATDPAAARAALADALDAGGAARGGEDGVQVLRALALVCAPDDPGEAARAFGALDRARGERVVPSERAAEDAARTALRAQLGSRAFELAYVAGTLLPAAELLAAARERLRAARPLRALDAG